MTEIYPVSTAIGSRSRLPGSYCRLCRTISFVQEIEIYSASTAIAFQAERCPGLPAGHAGNIVCLGEQKGCYSARTGGPNQKFRDDKRDPQFQHAADILRNADIGFGNFEGNTIDIRYFKGYPAGSLDDADITGAPDLAKSLKSMGFKIMSHANNHSTDWGLRSCS